MVLRKLLCVLSALSLLITTAYAEDSAAMDFTELPALVELHSVAYKLRLRDLDGLQAQITDYKDELDRLIHSNLGSEIFTLYPVVQAEMNAVEEAYTKLSRQLADNLADCILAARHTYIDYHIALLDVEISEHELDYASSRLAVAERKQTLGVISAAELAVYADDVKALANSVEAAHKAADAALDAFSALFDADAVPSGVPRYDVSAVLGRDYDADLAAYVAHSPLVAEKRDAVTAAEKEMWAKRNLSNRHTYQAAVDDLAAARQAAADAFAALYGDLTEAVSDYLTSTAVDDGRRTLENVQEQFKLGTTPKSSVAAAQAVCHTVTIVEKQSSLRLLKLYAAYLRAVGDTLDGALV